MKSERQHRQEIVRIGSMIHERGYVAATDGNLSVRLSESRILVTPTAMCKGMMKPSDLVVVDPQGKKVRGQRDFSSEIAMHLLIYRLRKDVNAVVHAHPPTATGYAAARQPLNPALLTEVVIALEDIPLAEYGTPGTSELCDTLAPLVPRYQAILMSNHGVVTYGADLLTAYMHMETVEHFAKVALVAHMLGRQHLLSEEDLRKLATAREKYAGGNHSHKNGAGRASEAKSSNGKDAVAARKR
ncbi:MAG TPA: class II aldolase/adducin family protein [Terriglobales bacterium]|nr:class II aldolase/adducin family protein [Terriglobales bacterium]